MIKEYIDQLYQENNEELDRLENQMKKLMEELSCANEWLESLQRQSNLQTNIFSPRSIDDEMDSKMETAQDTVKNTKQQIEYTREMMEAHIKKKQEYEVLKEELKNTNISDNESQTHQEDPELEKDNLKKENTEKESLEKENLEKESLEKDKILKLLSDLYRETEICLAFLNGDKNKCRKELNNMRSVIKKAVSEIEDKEN